PTSRLPTIASIAANRWWENHIAGACPPKYNRFSRRREFRSGFFADLRADVRVPVLVWEEEVQSQPIVRLSAHVSYSYFYFADHVFEIACKDAYTLQPLPPFPLSGDIRIHPIKAAAMAIDPFLITFQDPNAFLAFFMICRAIMPPYKEE